MDRSISPWELEPSTFSQKISLPLLLLTPRLCRINQIDLSRHLFNDTSFLFLTCPGLWNLFIFCPRFFFFLVVDSFTFVLTSTEIFCYPALSRSGRYKIRLISSSTNIFSAHRGIRLGDPLSPYMYLVHSASPDCSQVVGSHFHYSFGEPLFSYLLDGSHSSLDSHFRYSNPKHKGLNQYAKSPKRTDGTCQIKSYNSLVP